MANKSKKGLTQNQLFALIYDVFAQQFGDVLPSVDLLRAADTLTKLIDDDFQVHAIVKFRGYSNYYSHELTWAFSQRPWQIGYFEQRCDLLGDERRAMNLSARTVLRELLGVNLSQ